jgi:hypothetical protein
MNVNMLSHVLDKRMHKKHSNVLSKAVLVYMFLVLAGYALFGGSEPIHRTDDHPDKSTYRWCKVGETPKKNNCVDGSGSGG